MYKRIAAASAVALLAVPAAAQANSKVNVSVHYGPECNAAVISVGRDQTNDPVIRYFQTLDDKRLPGAPAWTYTQPFEGSVHDEAISLTVPEDNKTHKVWVNAEVLQDGKVIGSGQNYAEVKCGVPDVVSPPPVPPVPPTPVPPVECVPVKVKIIGTKITPKPSNSRNVWTAPGKGTWRLDGQIRARNTDTLRLRSSQVGRLRHGKILQGSRYGWHVLTWRGSNGCKNVTARLRVFNLDPVKVR